MAYMSTHSTTLSDVSPEHLALLKLFNKANLLPDILTSHNSALMQKAFLSAAQDNWKLHLQHLQEALQAKNTVEGTRKFLLAKLDFYSDITEPLLVVIPTGVAPTTDNTKRLLAQAFLEKYEELRDKIDYDYEGFFPYQVSDYNQYLLVFKKLPPEAITRYILEFK